MPVVTTSSKGQIVIPKEIREQLGLRPGQKVSVKLVGDHAEIQPLPTDPVRALRGIFKEYPGSLARELVEERKREAQADENDSA